MVTKSLSLVLLGVLLALSVSVEGCNRFCQTPSGDFVCCETPPPTPPPHPGKCPKELNTFCGGNKVLNSGVLPPQPCNADHECKSRNLKCCRDKCLKIDVCKPSVF